MGRVYFPAAVRMQTFEQADHNLMEYSNRNPNTAHGRSQEHDHVPH